MSSRFNRGSDAELCYASGELPTPDPLSELYDKPDRRKRRTRGSSEDDEDQEQPEYLLNEDFRAGGPSLCPVPVVSLPVNLPEVKALDENPHRSNVFETLRSWNVDVRGYGVCMRRSQFYMEDTPVPTLLILAKKHKLDSNWRKACKQIRSFLNLIGCSHVSVEIAHERAFEPTQCFPIKPNNAIYPVWNQVRTTILHEIDLEDWKILECFRLGTSQNPNNNFPTIMVTVDGNSTQKWQPVREHIVGILNRFNLKDVAVAIAKGRVWRSTNGGMEKDLPPSTWEKKAQFDISLGFRGSLHSSATFGGYLDLKNKKGNWHRFETTCYHAILPDTRLLGPKDKNSIYVGDEVAKEMQIEQPSLQDFDAHLKKVESEISGIMQLPSYVAAKSKLRRGEPLFGPEKRQHELREQNLKGLRQRKETMLDFRQSGDFVLGTVFAASGDRLKKGAAAADDRQFDWALIELDPGRIGEKQDRYVWNPEVLP